jgi:hypothetical protein
MQIPMFTREREKKDMTLAISGNMPHANGNIDISEVAAKRANMSFNPSKNAQIDRVKTLAAALYTEIEDLCVSFYDGSGGDDGTVQREASTAANHIQAGAMFAVSAIAHAMRAAEKKPE